MNNRKRPYRKMTSFQCPGQCRRISAKIPTIDATTIAHILILAFISSLLYMDRLRIGDMRTSGLYQLPFGIILRKVFFKILLDAAHFKTRHHFAIGQFGQTIFVPGDAYKFFNVTIPRFDILIPDGPVYCESISNRSFKIEITPTLCLPGPQ